MAQQSFARFADSCQLVGFWDKIFLSAFDASDHNKKYFLVFLALITKNTDFVYKMRLFKDF